MNLSIIHHCKIPIFQILLKRPSAAHLPVPTARLSNQHQPNAMVLQNFTFGANPILFFRDLSTIHLSPQWHMRKQTREVGKWLTSLRPLLPASIFLNHITSILYSTLSLTSSSSPNQVFILSPRSGRFCSRPTYGSLIGNNIRDVRNWSRWISRSKSCHRMYFYKNNHLKAALDGCYSHRRQSSSSEAKKKKRRKRMCVCVKI